MKVNSLTHMVVVVDENCGDNATADLEEQLQVSGNLMLLSPQSKDIAQIF